MSSTTSLDSLIISKLTERNLRSDEETTEFIKGLVEEESFEQEDRKSAILGMLEADEEDEITSSAVDQLLESTSAHQAEVEEKRRAEEAAKAPPKPAEEEKSKKKLTPEEEEKRKLDLIRQYGRIEEESEAERQAREAAEGSTVPDKALIDPSKLSKKQRKKAFDGVDLLALPNMNKAHVAAAERDRRNQDAAKSQAKREKDKADLKKQKEDAIKKLADKQKKAQKVERKA